MIPIISAMRCQAVPLATAVLSNHLEYPHYEFVDLSAHMRDFMNCWDKNEIDFHAIVSGFLASPEQIHLVEEAINRFEKAIYDKAEELNRPAQEHLGRKRVLRYTRFARHR